MAMNGIEQRNFIHGHAVRGEETPTYKSWHSMMSRCNSRSNTAFKRYGGKGITVYGKWWDFTKFLEDMGEKPTDKHTIGRIDHNGNYEPGNCEWQTRTKQARTAKFAKLNMRKAREIRMLYKAGYYVQDLCVEFGVSRHTIYQVISGQTWKEEDGTTVSIARRNY